MKKILFIMGSYFPNPSANGICINEIAKKCLADNIEVHILATNLQSLSNNELINEVNVHRIKEDYLLKTIKNKKGFISKIFKLFNKVSGFFKTISNFNYSKKRVEEFKSNAISIVKENNIDTIVSVIQPVESLIIIPELKKEFENVKIVPYFLDLPNEKKFDIQILNSLWQNRSYQLYNKVFPYCDGIFTLEVTRKYFSQSFFDSYQKKIEYVDIPLFRSTETTENENQEYSLNKHKNIVFTGTLSKNVRNPEGILNVFSKVYEETDNFVLHIYGKGCEEILTKYKEILGDSLIIHGQVELNKAYEAMNNADILLNISNVTQYQIPSKIFEYFATGKPIINFRFLENDSANEYYDKYNNIFKVDNWNKEKNLRELVEFIENPPVRLIQKDLMGNFEKNTPNYFIKQLEKV